MRIYKVNRLEHKVYEPGDTTPSNIKIFVDWRDGHIGDWVKTDDEHIIQILRRGKLLRPKGKVKYVEYVGTCTGTFLISKGVKMDASRRINIYSFSGEKTAESSVLDRKNLNTREKLFVTYHSLGMDIQTAYMKAFPTNNPGYAKVKAGQLMSTTRIRTAMKEELKPVCEELGIDEKFILKNIKSEAENADKPDTRLKALFKLSDIMDLEDKNRVQTTQLTGVQFSGFNPEDLLEATSPKEITNGSD